MINLDEIRFEYINLQHLPDTYQLDMTHYSFPCPIGTIWFRFLSDNETIEILNSTTNTHWLRQGVRTFLSKKLLDDYPMCKRFSTGGGTESSTPWMMNFGYKNKGTHFRVSRDVFLRKFEQWKQHKQEPPQDLQNN